VHKRLILINTFTEYDRRYVGCQDVVHPFDDIRRFFYFIIWFRFLINLLE